MNSTAPRTDLPLQRCRWSRSGTAADRTRGDDCNSSRASVLTVSTETTTREGSGGGDLEPRRSREALAPPWW
jgi:hypothetical protein